MLTTDSLGRVSNRYNYDAYGTNYTGSFSGKNKIGYNSKHYDTGTGWYNYGYRDYDSKLGRFTTQDPIRDGMNWYAYCGGDPINLIDLWGYNPVAIGLTFGGVIIIGAAYIAVTQNESYQNAIKETAAAISDTVSNINQKINETTVNVTIEIVNSVQNQLSKGKTNRDPEGNPIPLDQQSPGPLGKGANAGPENIGDPGDFGGPDFKPPKDPSPKEKLLLAGVAGALLYDNLPNNSLPDSDSSATNENSAENSVTEFYIKKGK